MKIYNGYERLPRNYTTMIDEYEMTMANGYLMNNKQNQEAVFDVFFRKIPNNGGYAIMAGLDKIIPFIQNFKFDERALDYFRRKGYQEEFINYLRDFKFTGDIYAIPDGTPVFPNEPIITVKAPLIEAQIIETAILSMVNGAMEHATGARRIVEATPSNVGIMEFGARRADGCEAAIDSSIYGIMSGCIGTSNIIAADMLNMKAMGTQAHSWIESYPTEYDAFLSYAKVYPNNCILLVDTLDTLSDIKPTHIVMPGDLYDVDVATMFNRKVTCFINDATDIAPVFYVKGDSEDRGALYSMKMLPKGLDSGQNKKFHVLNEENKELNINKLFEIWNNTSLQHFSLTSVGIILGANNNTQVTGEKFNMHIWI